MAGVDQLDEAGAVDMCVYLGRRNVGMTEERLEDSKVGAA
jgi:hypothetical protein